MICELPHVFFLSRESDDSVGLCRPLFSAMLFSPGFLALDKLQLAAGYAADNAQRQTGGQPDQNAHFEHNEHRE